MLFDLVRQIKGTISQWQLNWVPNQNKAVTGMEVVVLRNITQYICQTEFFGHCK